MDVIVGLGNPGAHYKHTRHNLGFKVVDALARKWQMRLVQREADALCGQGRTGNRPVLLAKPQTHMNLSGQSVASLQDRYVQADDRLIVIHDDLDLDLGKIKIKRRGGDAGHRGIRSIIEWLGTGEFSRIRMGIGRPPCRDAILEHVLSPFSADEYDAYHTMMTKAVESVIRLLAEHDHPDR